LEFGAPAPQAPALAENLPASVGYNDPAREAMKFQVFSAIAPILAELSQEVRRSMDYYRGRAGDAFVNEIQLVGGTANLKGLAQFLEMELGIPVRVPDVMKHVQITAKSMSQNYAHEVAPLFPISIGLGVRELIGGPSTKKSKPKGTSKK
jgi:Tfp pilus assembly PilM family ATPase